jgi:hypothetical protein
MRECCRAAVEASFGLFCCRECCREFIYFPPVSKYGGFLWRGPRTLPLSSVLDAYFVSFAYGRLSVGMGVDMGVGLSVGIGVGLSMYVGTRHTGLAM